VLRFGGLFPGWNLEVPDLFNHGFGAQIMVQEVEMVRVYAVRFHIFEFLEVDLEGEVPSVLGAAIRWKTNIRPHHTWKI